jgi:hypothetical protein
MRTSREIAWKALNYICDLVEPQVDERVWNIRSGHSIAYGFTDMVLAQLNDELNG